MPSVANSVTKKTELNQGRDNAKVSDRPAVSFVVPVYNVEPYLRQCIQSIQTQSLSDLEIVCVNDGSTDNSWPLLEALAAADTRIRLHDQANAGVSAARNAGINMARGKYICFVDADDWIEADYASLLFERAEADAADIVVFSGHVIPGVAWIEGCLETSNTSFYTSADDDDGFDAGEGVDTNGSTRASDRSKAIGAKVLLSENACIPLMCNKFYRRSIIKDHRVCFDTEVALGEDLLFQFATFPYAKTIAFTTAKLYNYRTDRENSAVSSTSDKITMLHKHLDLLRRVVEKWQGEGWLEGHQSDLLQATKLLFVDIFLLSYADFCYMAKMLYSLVTELFGEDFLRNLARPQPHYFYTIIERAAKDELGWPGALRLKAEIALNRLRL